MIALNDEVLSEMARRGTWYVPTFAVYRWHGTRGPEFKQLRARALWEPHRDSFQRALRAGVQVAMGTDIGGYGYGDTALELELLVENGLTPAEAIVTATRRSAECLRLDSQVGTLEPGKQADIAVLTPEPYVYDAGKTGNAVAAWSPYDGMTLPYRVAATQVSR